MSLTHPYNNMDTFAGKEGNGRTKEQLPPLHQRSKLDTTESIRNSNTAKETISPKMKKKSRTLDCLQAFTCKTPPEERMGGLCLLPLKPFPRCRSSPSFAPFPFASPYATSSSSISEPSLPTGRLLSIGTGIQGSASSPSLPPPS